jgi:hypothetical protein
LVLLRRPETASPAAGPKPRGDLTGLCDCGRRIRAVRSTLELARSICGACGSPFTASDSDANDMAEHVPEKALADRVMVSDES